MILFHICIIIQLKFLGEVCLTQDYNKLVRPFNNQTMDILLDFEILQIVEVNDHDFSINFVMYFGITWDEPRIVMNSTNPELYHSIDLEFFNSLWVPDIYFYHLKSTSSRKILTDFAGK